MTKSNPPMAAPEVFAYCIYADTGQDYAVYRVAARRRPNGAVAMVDNPPGEFPNAGTIRVLLRNLRLPGSRKGNHAFFALEEDPHFAEHKHNPKGMKFRAIGAMPSGMQLVPLPFGSKQHDEIGETLRTGVPVLGEPTERTQVLLELNDGVVVGPFALRAVPDSHNYRAEESALHSVKSGWKSAATLPVVSLELDYRTYRFVFAELPAPELSFDASPAAFAIKRALEFLAEQKSAENIISKNKARDIATVLAKLQPPAELKARCDRVLVLLERYALANGEAEEFMELALETPAVRAQLEKEVAAAREQARMAANDDLKSVLNQLKAAKVSLKLVEEQKEQTKADIVAAENKITDLEKRYSEVETALGKKMHVHVEKARTDTAELLASITLLRPFLQPEATPVVAEAQASCIAAPTAPVVPVVGLPSASSSRMPIAWRAQEQPNALVDSRDSFSHLLRNLTAVGVKEPGASRVAATCVAAFSAGQAISVRGSAASELANAITVSFFGAQWAEINVPIGYVDLEDLQSVKPSSGELGGVLFLGANQSCLSAYAGEWIAPFRMGGRPSASSSPAVFRLSEGPSALGPVPQYSELGPVIHSDALRWSAPAGVKLIPGSFKSRLASKVVDLEKEINLIEESLVPARNVSALLAARAAFPLLVEVAQLRGNKVTFDQAIKEALAEVTVSWVIPTLGSAGAGRASLAGLEAAVGEDKTVSAAMVAWFGNSSPG